MAAEPPTYEHLLEPCDTQVPGRGRSATRSPHRELNNAFQAEPSGSSTTDQLVIERLMKQNEDLIATLKCLMTKPVAPSPEVTRHPIVPPMVLELKSKEIPASMLKELSKHKDTFEKNALRKLRVTEYVAKKTEGFRILFSEKGYPSGLRSFKTPSEFAQLDNVFQSAKEVDWEIVMQFPKGCTKREAAEIAYRANLKITVALELEAHHEHLDALSSVTSKEYFYTSCKAISRADCSVDGLDVPDLPQVHSELFEVKVEQAYASVIAKIKKQKDDDKKTQDLKSKRLKEEENLVSTTSPQYILKDLISEVVKEEMCAKTGDVPMQAPETAPVPKSTASSTKTSDFVNALYSSKNGKSPGAALGHSNNPRGGTDASRRRKSGGKQQPKGGGKTKKKPSYSEPRNGKGGKHGSKGEQQQWQQPKGGGKGRTKGKGKGEGKGQKGQGYGDYGNWR
jgi:hypothetical protein